MKTFWNTQFRQRDPECSTIVAIKANVLPKTFDPEIWRPNGLEVREGIELRRLGIFYANKERYEIYGYL